MTLGFGDDRTDLDFGFQPLGTIGDLVYADVDGNGVTSGVCATELDVFLQNQDALSLNDCYNACE